MELHSFPPWQIRLTDIFYEPLSTQRFVSFLLDRRSDARLINEQDFRRALDQFAKVDMKVGK
ncbi:hypothetical protein M407DRAFT_29484 [Tulasnella calospora MUT 4182]|uniref:Uncharacterized protein n=1 Tax=Tulasnella calospora MUT 4182 TaxID=1051891 RepID=A0A0C3PZF7_9AGAM|nr:hypothetical protein M407DRAFT_29484 [Tulasnella calospora MUT 4182]